MFGSNPFGQSSSSPFGSQPIFGQPSSSTSNPYAPKPFGSTSPFSGQTGGSIFGSMSTSLFGAQSSSPLGSTSVFGASSSPAFGSSTPTFGASTGSALGNTSSAFGGSSIFGQKPAFGGFGSSTTQTSPFGSSFPQSQPSFGSNLFGAPSQPTFGSSSSPAFGASSTPTFGSTSTPAFGSTGFGVSSSPFGSRTPAFGASSTPAFGASSTLVFGASSTPAFGVTSTPAFGASSPPTFGSTSTPAFGSTGFGASSSPFGSSTPAFGASSTPAFGASSTPVFGASSTPAFGATSSPAFGATSTPAFGATTTPAFGASSTPSFIFGSSPAFGQSSSAFGNSPFCATSSLGAQSSSFGAQSATPDFGSPGFVQSGFGGQRGVAGSRVSPYSETTETNTSTQPPEKLESISAMPVYKDKSQEQLRWEDYQLGDKGGSAPAGQVAVAGFGSSGFGASSTPSFGQSFVNPFSSSSSSNPFPPKIHVFSSPGFGTSSTAAFWILFPCLTWQCSLVEKILHCAAQTANPAFGSPSFGQSGFGGQQGGSRVSPYSATTETDSGTQPPEKLESISAMPIYKDKSHEELKWEDYQLGDKGGPAPAGQAAVAGFGSSGFGASSTLAFGAQTATPAFGSPSSSCGQSGFGGQRVGSRVSPYSTTTETDTGTQPPEKLESISAMPIYEDKSHEELRREDYRLGDKGGPAPASRAAVAGFGSSGFGASSTPAFGQSSANPFSSSSSSNPFAPKTPVFSSPGFGSSSTSAFGSTPFGTTSSNPFGSTTSSTTPSLLDSTTQAFGVNTSPSMFSSSSSAFGSPSIFGSTSAPGTGSAFGTGFGFGNTQSSPLFQSTTPILAHASVDAGI